MLRDNIRLLIGSEGWQEKDGIMLSTAKFGFSESDSISAVQDIHINLLWLTEDK
jgi:hypothetical protein